MGTMPSTSAASMAHMDGSDDALETTAHEIGEMTGSSKSILPDAAGQESMGDMEPAIEEPFPFMKLPLEMRRRVYDMHLVMAEHITIGHGCYYGTPQVCQCPDLDQPSTVKCVPFNSSITNLWSVSKAIYYESIPVFFRFNRFNFVHLDRLHAFLSGIGPTSRRYITSIRFIYDGRAPARAIKVLKECVGLRRLTILITFTTIYLIQGIYKLTRLHGCTDLLKVRGIEELEIIVREDASTHPLFNDKMVREFREALQIVKKPYPPAHFTRQEKKYYPQSSGRTVFGKANVKTRAEKKLLALYPSSSS